MRQALLVTLADRNFVDQAKQLFSSVYWNAGWKGEYMLLACDVPEADLKWFKEKQILVKEVMPHFNSDAKDETLRYPATVTCKLALLSEEFKSWTSVVFIDADCIVRYPLESLTKLRGFAAARDWLTTALIKHQAKPPERMGDLEYIQQFNGYSLTATAFNTGVFAFNTHIIKDTTQAELRQIFEKYKNVARFPEQLWMNLYFYKKWERLPMEYNLFASYLHLKRGLPISQVDGVVLHFPRHGDDALYRCWDSNNPFYGEWKRNLERAEMIDLKHNPKVENKWPGAKHLLFQKWRLRLALCSDYVNFSRDKVCIRSRMRNFISR